MGIDATCRVKICFVGGNRKEALELLNRIKANDIIIDDIGKLDFKEKWIADNDVTQEGNKPMTILSFICDDRDFWFERWGLRAIKDNVKSWDVINSWEDYADWHVGYCEFCKTVGCILELETCAEQEHKERFVIDANGIILLREENYIMDRDSLDSEWFNLEYGKKSFDNLIIEHYMLEHQPS